MIVPVQILQNLKCSNCEDLLSCGPVLLKQDGTDICGRCSNLEQPAVPNKPYNELAKKCMFPCKYEAEGCYEKFSFSSMKQHEADCEFRTYNCPVMPSGTCEWIGFRNKMLEHTREKHPEKILEHPCEMEHNVKTASLKTFLTTAFDVLFLVHVKICLTTYTIYHSVRKIGEINKKRVFKYQLNIEHENGNLIRKEDVAPQGNLTLQEESSIAVEINSLMKAFPGLKNTKFIITLQESMKCYICKTIKNADQIEIRDKINNIFSCQTCSSILHSCKNSSQGCTWKGKYVTNSIHEYIFCPYTKWCVKCKNNIKEINMLDHIRYKKHSGSNHLFGKYQTVSKDKEIAVTLSFKNTTYMLSYLKLQNLNTFYIQGRHNDAKSNFVLILRNPQTKYVLHYNTNKCYSLNESKFVWMVNLHNDKLRPFIHDNKFEIGVDVYSFQ